MDLKLQNKLAGLLESTAKIHMQKNFVENLSQNEAKDFNKICH